ncbi:MAG: DUF2778 domain-containing protein [Yersiniaceae bacterium]|nr:DUF2778 domain-containing protein [Yersiniaceae bacterium]
MLNFTFELNGQPMSALKGAGRSYPAFSGLGSYVNRRSTVCTPSKGAIPPGDYLIVDRESGGLFSTLRDIPKGKIFWYALYRIDKRIDDYLWCNAVTRGNFRLHPLFFGQGVSRGCITLPSMVDYTALAVKIVSHGK